MSIPNRQIGWSNEANLLWYISSELEQIICQAACCTTTSTSSTSSTTTTTTTLPPCAVYSVTATVQNSYSRYIDCNTGEPVFLGPMEQDKPVFVCALRDSVEFTFGTGTITEVTSPCPTPSYTCNDYVVVHTDTITVSYLDCASAEPKTGTYEGEGEAYFCVRTGSLSITSGTGTITDTGDCTTCKEYSATFNTAGEILYLDCDGGVQLKYFEESDSFGYCAKVGSTVVLSGDVTVTELGNC